MAHRVCPWWLGYFLSCPLRKLFQNPHEILKPFTEPGMKVLDAGCAMGFFSLELARIVGPGGKVYSVDLQEKMLSSLKRRAHRAGLSDRIETRKCSFESLNIDDLTERIDLACAMNVVHEVENQELFFKEIFSALKPGSRIIIVEPAGHVSENEFAKSIETAVSAGFSKEGQGPVLRKSYSALLVKKQSN